MTIHFYYKAARKQQKRGKMKKLLVMILYVAISMVCFVLSACTLNKQELADAKNLKIGITVYNQYDTFISELIDELVKYADIMEEKYKISITLEILSASSNQLTQNDQMGYFIEQECDIVCVNLVDRTDVSTIIERGRSADLPIIFFNRELVEEDLLIETAKSEKYISMQENDIIVVLNIELTPELIEEGFCKRR